MGKGGPLAFLNKKPWHPGNARNQEEVWKREQAFMAEVSKAEELKREIEAEREKEEWERVAENARKSKKSERVEWMYQGGFAAQEEAAKRKDEFLLGKHAELPAAQEAKSGVEAAAALPPVEAEQVLDNPNEAWARLNADPLLWMKRQEQAKVQSIVSNPYHMMQIKDKIRKSKGEKKAKKEKKEKKEGKKSKSKHKEGRSASPAPRAASPAPRKRPRESDFADEGDTVDERRGGGNVHGDVRGGSAPQERKRAHSDTLHDVRRDEGRAQNAIRDERRADREPPHQRGDRDDRRADRGNLHHRGERDASGDRDVPHHRSHRDAGGDWERGGSREAYKGGSRADALSDRDVPARGARERSGERNGRDYQVPGRGHRDGEDGARRRREDESSRGERRRGTRDDDQSLRELRAADEDSRSAGRDRHAADEGARSREDARAAPSGGGNEEKSAAKAGYGLRDEHIPEFARKAASEREQQSAATQARLADAAQAKARAEEDARRQKHSRKEYVPGKASAEEKARRLAEMTNNASELDQHRTTRLVQSHEQNQEDGTGHLVAGKTEAFVQRAQNSIVFGSDAASLQEQIRRKRGTLQR